MGNGGGQGEWARRVGSTTLFNISLGTQGPWSTKTGSPQAVKGSRGAESAQLVEEPGQALGRCVSQLSNFQSPVNTSSSISWEVSLLTRR